KAHGKCRWSFALDAPVLDPDPERLGPRAGEPERRAAGSCVRRELAAARVGQREMGEVDLRRAPRRIAGRRFRAKRVAEEGELETEVPPVTRAQIARIVPPLGAEFEMRAVVTRKREVARPGRARVPADVGAAEDIRDGDRRGDASGRGFPLTAQPEGGGSNTDED